KRAVLLRQHVEVRRPRPAESSLVGSCPPPRPPRFEEVGAFPPVLDAENRPLVLEALVQGAGPPGPTPLVGVERVAQVVVVAIGLARQLGCIAVVAVHRPKAPRPV